MYSLYILVLLYIFLTSSIIGGLPGVLGNKGTWPIIFREQGNICHYFQGTREHGNNYREQGNMKIINFREQGNMKTKCQNKFKCNQTSLIIGYRGWALFSDSPSWHWRVKYLGQSKGACMCQWKPYTDNQDSWQEAPVLRVKQRSVNYSQSDLQPKRKLQFGGVFQGLKLAPTTSQMLVNFAVGWWYFRLAWEFNQRLLTEMKSTLADSDLLASE